MHWLDAITPPLESHLESLANTLLAVLGKAAQRPPLPVAPPPVFVPAAAVSPQAAKTRTGLYVAVAAAVILVATLSSYFLFSHTESQPFPRTRNSEPAVQRREGAMPTARDPVVGCWQWFNGVPVTIYPDGRLVAGPFTAR